ncbi:hypothetical protein LF844_13740 [Metapseudomonas lalkuanensis]|nr:hypothetical protein [Pseudomonas lalkuanensis]UCP00814.1 hypothetical protein LF844_13740 [Pseudomonas lalkuanensis]
MKSLVAVYIQLARISGHEAIIYHRLGLNDTDARKRVGFYLACARKYRG